MTSYYYRSNIKITESDGPLVIIPLQPVQIFLVMTGLTYMLTVKGLFSGLRSENPHAHIEKVRYV